jgi:hypothetical protein
MWGCTDGSVGSDDCFGERVRCEIPIDADNNPVHLESGEYAEVATKNLDELAPTWIRPLPMTASESRWSNMLLTNDFEGDVWLFTQREKQLIANKLDADGQVAESQAFDAPRNWEVFDVATLDLSSYRQSGHGPTLRVNWPAQVKGEALDPLNSIEWIKFGDSFDDPKRLVADKDSAYWDLELIWDVDDAIYGMKSRFTVENGSLEKFDREGNRVWKQTAMSRLLRGSARKFFGLLGDHQVGMFMAEQVGITGSVIGADGNYAATLGMPYWAPSATMQSMQQGARGPVILAESGDDDLYVAHLQTKPPAAKTVMIRRDDYLAFSDVPSAVDPKGNVYVALVFGGRDIGDQRRAICRVPFEGESSCMQLAKSSELEVTESNPMELATNADGVLFLRTDKAFVRIDFPGR